MAGRILQSDSFPVIARLIKQCYRGDDQFVTHKELVNALLADAAGMKLIDSAYTADEGAKQKEWWAGNMVAWFSQQFNSKKWGYALQFERTVKLPYGYRPTVK